MPESSAFELVGGRSGVEALVAAFYTRVEADPLLRPLYPDDLEPGRAKLAMFLEQWLGGATRYSDQYGHPRLRIRHFPFVIDDAAAEAWLRNFAAALEEAAIDPPTAGMIYERLQPLAHHMVNAGEDVPRAPLKETFLR
jgi:hemoglobin